MFSEVANTVFPVDRNFAIILWTSVFFTVLLSVIMIYFVWRYSAKRNPVASQIHGNHTLEFIWTAVPSVIVLVFFYYGWIDYRFARTIPKDSLEIKAVGRMWSWSFEYPNGKKSAELYVPVGRPVHIKLASVDVLHSFFIPAFRVKTDVIPGFDRSLWFTAEKAGSYDVFCTEYCGERHSYMLTKAIAEPPETFKDWLGPDQLPKDQLTPGGKELMVVHGCVACHSTDGTQIIGPTYKGLFGRKATVVAGGVEKEIVADEAYVRNAILNPQSELVKGFPPVMPKPTITEAELDAMVKYLKTLK